MRNQSDGTHFLSYAQWVIVLCSVTALLLVAGCSQEEPVDPKAGLKTALHYITELERENQQMSQQIAAMKKKLEGGQPSEPSADMDEALAQAIEENQALKEKLAALEEAATPKALVSTDHKEMETKISEELTRLEAKNKSLIDRNETYEKEIAALRMEVKEKDVLSAKLEQLEKKNKTLSQQKTALEQEVAGLRTTAAQFEQLTEEMKALQTENEKLITLNETMRSRLEEIQNMTTADVTVGKKKHQ
jgi:chromosome segregation ATPase